MRYLVVPLLALAACGGSSSFDRQAVESNMDATPAFLDAAADLCAVDDDVYELTLAMMIDGGDTSAVAAQAYGCADRYRDVAEVNGWPMP